jgi:hypothetical protein
MNEPQAQGRTHSTRFLRRTAVVAVAALAVSYDLTSRMGIQRQREHRQARHAGGLRRRLGSDHGSPPATTGGLITDTARGKGWTCDHRNPAFSPWSSGTTTSARRSGPTSGPMTPRSSRSAGATAVGPPSTTAQRTRRSGSRPACRRAPPATRCTARSRSAPASDGHSEHDRLRHRHRSQTRTPSPSPGRTAADRRPLLKDAAAACTVVRCRPPAARAGGSARAPVRPVSRLVATGARRAAGGRRGRVRAVADLDP